VSTQNRCWQPGLRLLHPLFTWPQSRQTYASGSCCLRRFILLACNSKLTHSMSAKGCQHYTVQKASGKLRTEQTRSSAHRQLGLQAVVPHGSLLVLATIMKSVSDPSLQSTIFAVGKTGLAVCGAHHTPSPRPCPHAGLRTLICSGTLYAPLQACLGRPHSQPQWACAQMATVLVLLCCAVMLSCWRLAC
jgi:hypothetical protein